MSDEKRAKDETKTVHEKEKDQTAAEITPSATEPGPADTKDGNRSYMGTIPGEPEGPREGGRSYEA